MFTPRYLCFGPQGADIVSIPNSQTDRRRPTIFFYSLHPPTLSPSFLSDSLIVTFHSYWRKFTISSPPFLSITMFTCCGSSLSLPLACFFSLTIPHCSSCGPLYLHFHLFVCCDAAFILPTLIPSCSTCLTLTLFSSTYSSFFCLSFLLPFYSSYVLPSPLLSYIFFPYFSFCPLIVFLTFF